MLRWRLLVAVSALVLGTSALAQTETLLLKRASDLRQGPSESTAVVASLPAQTPVTRQPERQGPWMRITTATGQSGWIHMFDVGASAPPTSTGSTATGMLRGLTSFLNRSNTPSTTTATATVGIRGMSAEDIANAQPNLSTLKQAEALRADAAQARKFAEEAQLAARAVDALPEPPPPTPANDAAANGQRGSSK
jgi:Bacterial SH3 domain